MSEVIEVNGVMYCRICPPEKTVSVEVQRVFAYEQNEEGLSKPRVGLVIVQIRDFEWFKGKR